MDAIAKATELRNRRAEITGEILEIQLAQVSIRREWVLNSIQTPLGKRIELEHRIAQLELERHTVDRELALSEKVRREINAGTFQARLVALLVERGLGPLVDEARRGAASDARAVQTQPTPHDEPPAP